MRSTRRRLLFLIPPLLFAGILCGLIYREIRQIRRNQALIAAVKRNDAEMVRTLLEQGVDVNTRDDAGRPISLRHIVLDWLSGKRRSHSTGPTALAVAMDAQAAYGNRNSRHWMDYSRVVTILLDKGADPNVVDKRSLTPLIIAARTGNFFCLQALLAHGARVNTQDFFHGTALEYATWGPGLECVQALLDHGADVNHKDDWGDDALGGAADQDRLDIMRLLLDHGADPKATNKAGTTALSLMVRHGNMAAVRLLLSKGADPNATDVMGRSCLFWVRGKPHSEMVALLRTAGATK